MMFEHTLFLLFVYSILIVINMYAIGLYYYAYVKMKRTRMIKSVFVFLLCFLFENIYFFIVVKNLYIQGTNVVFYMVHPLLWAVPKITVMLGLSYFIYSSLQPNDCIDVDEINHIKKIKQSLKTNK